MTSAVTISSGPNVQPGDLKGVVKKKVTNIKKETQKS